MSSFAPIIWLGILAASLGVYIYSAIILTLATKLNNKLNNNFKFDISSAKIIKYTIFAWLATPILFILLFLISTYFSPLIKSILLLALPIIQQLFTIIVFYILCQSCLKPTISNSEPSKLKQYICSGGAALSPTILLLMLGGVWKYS